MPAIIVNDYTWRQSHDSIVISTRVLGHPTKIDLFAIDNYMKASYPPFILELFLWGAIVDESSECTIGDETAVFILKKKEIGVEWPSLVEKDLDKNKKRAQRSRALEMARISAEERAKAKSEKRQVLQSQAVRAQIDLDTQNLNKIEAIRDSHRREAMRDLEDWRDHAEKPIFENVTGIVQENRKAYRAPLKWFNDDGKPSGVRKSIEDSDTVNSQSKFPIEMTEEKKEHAGSGKLDNIEIEPSHDCAVNSSEHSIVNGPEKLGDDPTKSSPSRTNLGTDEFPQSTSSSDFSSSEEDSDLPKNVEKSARCSNAMDEKVRREFLRRKKRESVNRGKEIVRRVLANENSRFLAKSKDGIFEANGVGIPRPRKPCTIDVAFTERKFPTPARESHALEEQEWLEKQMEARRKTGFVSEDLRPEEQDPQWLKDKGDEFFKAGNYLGAISAYTHGIKLSDKMSSLYVNRSAAHYAAENYRRCAEDCSMALELMLPKCEGNRDSRARCHARLGAALCKLSAPQHGIPELEAALKLAPENETIKRDLQVARRYFEMRD